MKILTQRKDPRNNMISVLIEVSIRDFLQYVNDKKLLTDSKFEEQRDFLQTKKSQVITKRLADDLKGGALLPPITLGIIDESININSDKKYSDSEISNYFKGESSHYVAIVDGIQRTNIMQRVFTNNEINDQYTVLLDIVISDESFNLLNRMFVLNFGQTPWGEDQQASVVWNILDLKSTIDNLNPKHLLTFFYAYIYKKHDKVIQDDMDYVYTNLTLLESPLSKNIDGKIFDSIYLLSKDWGAIFGKDTVAFKTAFYAAFAQATDYDINKNTNLIDLLAIPKNYIPNLELAKMVATLNEFSSKSGVGARNRKFFYSMLLSIFEKIQSGKQIFQQEELEKIWDNAKEDANG